MAGKVENKKQTPEDRIMELWIAGMGDYIFKNNIHEILEEDGNELLKNWDISLNANGSLHFEYKDEDTSSIINLEEKTFSYIIKYKGEVVKTDNDEYRFHLFRDTIKTVNNYTRYKEAVSRSINTGETVFFSLDDKTVFKKHIISGKFIQKEDGKVYFTNEAFYSSKEGSDDDSIVAVNLKGFNEIMEVDDETDEFFLTTTNFIYPSGEGVSEVSSFLQKMAGSLVGKNPLELDLNVPVENVYVKVYNPDNTLLIETNDDNLITKIRCQIKERKLEGFYLTFTDPESKTETKISIDSNGRFDCLEGIYYPLNLTEKLSEKLLF